MARAYLNIVKNGLSSGDNTIYTCPQGGQAIVKVVNIYNTSGGAVTVSTKVLDSCSTTTGVWNETSVSASTQERVLQNGEVVFVNTCSGVLLIFYHPVSYLILLLPISIVGL